MIHFALRAAVLFVVFGAVASAQSHPERPDFSGTWTNANLAIVSITQNGQTITVRRPDRTYTYNLDGSDSLNQTNTGFALRSQARWVGSALVVTTTDASQIGAAWQDIHVYSMGYGETLTVVRMEAQRTLPIMDTSVGTYTRQAAVPGGR